MATNTTKAGLWDLEREDYNDDQNSEKANDDSCADQEYNENDIYDDESSETFRSLPAAPLGGSLTGGRKARTSPLIRSLLIMMMMMMVHVDLHIIRLSMICFHHNMKMPVGVGLQADQQGCRGQGGCSWCCR